MLVDGYIWDNQTGDGIPNASVMIADATGKETSYGTVADKYGHFALASGLLDQGYQLHITSAGYQGLIVSPTVFMESSGVGLDEGGGLVAYVVTALKKPAVKWTVIIGLLLLLLWAMQKKKGRLSGVDQKVWVDLALKVGIGLAVFFLILVPVLRKLGLWGKSDQAAKNEQTVDKSIKDLQDKGGIQATQTKTDAELLGMANQIYELGGESTVDQVAIRTTLIQVNTLADLLGLIKAFGTRKVGGSFLSLCGFFGLNCPEMDLPTFIKATAPDQLSAINTYLSGTGINYIF